MYFNIPVIDTVIPHRGDPVPFCKIVERQIKLFNALEKKEEDLCGNASEYAHQYQVTAHYLDGPVMQRRGFRIVMDTFKEQKEKLEHGKETGYSFPYLYDESQEIARIYDAACTPDFYLFDEHLHLVYRGRIDSSRPGNDKPLDGSDLRQAIDNVLAGKEISPVQYPSAGCNIKWK